MFVSVLAFVDACGCYTQVHKIVSPCYCRCAIYPGFCHKLTEDLKKVVAECSFWDAGFFS